MEYFKTKTVLSLPTTDFNVDTLYFLLTDAETIMDAYLRDKDNSRWVRLSLKDVPVKSVNSLSENVKLELSFNENNGTISITGGEISIDISSVFQKKDDEIEYSRLINKPQQFPPTEHSHDIIEINGLSTELENRYTKSESDNLLYNKVDKDGLKQLSDENFTLSEKNKLAGLSNYDDGAVLNEIANINNKNTQQDADISDLKNNKVDKISGKQLSTEDFTTDEKIKLQGLSNYDDSQINDSITNLQNNNSLQDTEIATKEPIITVGSSEDYYTGSKTWFNFFSKVRTFVLSMFTVGVNTPITNTDTIEGAFGKTQGQINAVKTDITRLNGINITFDQATATLNLVDGAGTKATISLVSLNNEGTKFSYNSTNKTLELKNDSNELLSAIPVSNFVSEVGKTLAFNGSNVANLELRDNVGTVLSTVNITVANVSGLQGQLNTKETWSNKVTNFNSPNNTTFPTTLAVKTAMDLKVDKISGKQLSTEDYTTAEKTKLAGLSNYNDGAVVAKNTEQDGRLTAIESKNTQQDADIAGKANTSHTHAISEVSGLQGALDSRQTTTVADGKYQVKGAYLTQEVDTLQTVVNRGNVTTPIIVDGFALGNLGNNLRLQKFNDGELSLLNNTNQYGNLRLASATVADHAITLGQADGKYQSKGNYVKYGASSGAITLNWIGVGGQPTWVFGGEDSGNCNVYDPANFRVANANTVGDVGVSELVKNNTDTFTSTPKVNHIVTLTQAEFNALATKDANTQYNII